MVCDMSLLNVDGEEYSFEEIRATKKPYFEEDFIEPERKQLASVAPLKARPVESSPFSNSKSGITSPSFNTITGMTVNSKQVMEEVMAMFRAPIQTPDKGNAFNSTDFEEEQEVTVTTGIFHFFASYLPPISDPIYAKGYFLFISNI
jgi:hypothetical protein